MEGIFIVCFLLDRRTRMEGRKEKGIAWTFPAMREFLYSDLVYTVDILLVFLLRRL